MCVRKFLASLGLCVGGLLSLPLGAAPVGELTLREAISRVLAENPQFYIYEVRQQALQGELQSAELNPPWELGAEVENFLGSNAFNGFRQAEWTLTLGRVIERGDKPRARGNVVRRRQALLDGEQQVLELDLLSETASRYIEIATDQARSEILARSVDLAASVLAAVNQRIDAGRSPIAERARAEAALAQARLAMRASDYAENAARYRLAALWGESNPGFSDVSGNLLQVEPVANIDQLLRDMRESPALTVFTSERRLHEAELALASARQAADYSLSGGIKQFGEFDDAAFVARFSMPLQSRERARGEMTTAQANLLRVESEERAALFRMQGQLLALNARRQSAVMQFDTLRSQIIPQLQTAFDQTRDAYENGLYGYLELGAAQQALLDAELALVDASAEAHQLRIEIERLSGQSLGFEANPTGGTQ